MIAYEQLALNLMGVRDTLRTFFGNVAKSVQLQAEIREGIANQADLFNRRLGELIKLQTDQSARNERLLKEILARLSNQSDPLGQRSRELGADSGNVGVAQDFSIDVSIAPLHLLPPPQISLRRPNPVVDLMVTREFKTYLDFFRASPSVSRSTLTAENHAILYALIRKTKPTQALVAFQDGAVVSETIARGLCDNRAGLLHLFDDLEGSRTRAMLDLWPDALRKLCVMESSVDTLVDLKCSFALVGGGDAEKMLPDLAGSLNALVEPGGLLVLTDVSRNGLRKLMSGRSEWRAFGKDQCEGENQPNLEVGPFVFLRES